MLLILYFRVSLALARPSLERLKMRLYLGFSHLNMTEDMRRASKTGMEGASIPTEIYLKALTSKAREAAPVSCGGVMDASTRVYLLMIKSKAKECSKYLLAQSQS